MVFKIFWLFIAINRHFKLKIFLNTAELNDLGGLLHNARCWWTYSDDSFDVDGTKLHAILSELVLLKNYAPRARKINAPSSSG